MRLAMLVPLFILVGCASSNDSQQSSEAGNSGMICTREKSTGSHFTTRVCRTPAQVDQQRKEARKVANTMNSGGGAVGGGETSP
jgi:hypothetical protein